MTCTRKRSRPNFRTTVYPPIGNLINDFFNTAIGDVIQQDEKHDSFNPRTNVLKFADRFELQMALPGYRKDQVEIEQKEDLLQISSKEFSTNAEGQKNFRLREFKNAAFRKVFKLPDTIEQSEIKATFNAGVLFVTLPIKKEELPKESTKITIT